MSMTNRRCPKREEKTKYQFPFWLKSWDRENLLAEEQTQPQFQSLLLKTMLMTIRNERTFVIKVLPAIERTRQNLIKTRSKKNTKDSWDKLLPAEEQTIIQNKHIKMYFICQWQLNNAHIKIRKILEINSYPLWRTNHNSNKNMSKLISFVNDNSTTHASK